MNIRQKSRAKRAADRQQKALIASKLVAGPELIGVVFGLDGG